MFLDLLSTRMWGGHLIFSGESQNSIRLYGEALKNFLREAESATICDWVWYSDGYIAHLAEWRESVKTTMWLIFGISRALEIPLLMANSSASSVVTFMA